MRRRGVRVIAGWRRALRLFSVQTGLAAVAFGLAPPDLQAAMLSAIGVPAERTSAVLGLLFLLARLINQTPDQAALRAGQEGQP